MVGNLVAGGSGKTPLVLWIAQFLKSKGWSPAIVSRGYGAAESRPQAATITSEASQVGDEPIILSRRGGCPVWVGADRVAVIRALWTKDVDVLILDDGLQHYRLRRDIEIAVVDGRGFGNGFLHPAGPLREPVSRLGSVDAVVSNGAAISRKGAFSMSLEGDTFHRMTDANDRRPAAAFAGQKVHAVAGIGDPNRFFLHLRALGIKAIPHSFPDHHPFTPRDLEAVTSSDPSLPVVMTEKDAVKLRRAAQAHWWVLPVSAKLDPAFGDWLLGKLGNRQKKRAE